MVQFTFRGLMAPVFTPFLDDSSRSLNTSIIPKYAQFLKEKGIDGILVNGTTGEGVSQTVDERETTAKAWIEASKTTGQTIMIQVGGTNLPDVKRLAAQAESLGAAAILCLADLFHQPKNAQDLLHYLQQVGASAPNTPLLYYHIPGFTGIDVNMRDFLLQAEQGPIFVPTLVGLKFTCNDLSMGSSLLEINPEKYAVFLGSDTILSAALCLGFDSAIGTTLNMFPSLNQQILNCINSSDVINARRAQQKLSTTVFTISQQGSWVGAMKSAMRALTPIDVGPVRGPLLDLNDAQVGDILAELKRSNVSF